MQRRKRILSRRAALKSLGLLGAGSLASAAEDSAGDEAAPDSDPALERLLCYTPCVAAVTSGRRIRAAVVATMAGLRVQSHCHIMGQAAGTAAALSLSAGVRPADVDPAQLQRRRVDAGVLIDLRGAEQASVPRGT